MRALPRKRSFLDRNTDVVPCSREKETKKKKGRGKKTTLTKKERKEKRVQSEGIKCFQERSQRLNKGITNTAIQNTPRKDIDKRKNQQGGCYSHVD